MTLAINKIYNQDCLKGLRLLSTESVDEIVTDPPYGIQFGENEGLYKRAKQGILEGYIDIPAAIYKSFTDDWVKECYRVLKATGSIYIVSGWQHFSLIETALKEVGFIVKNHIYWQYQFGVNTKRNFVTSCNPILFAVKDNRRYKFYRNARFQDNDKLPNGNSSLYKDLENVWYITKERWEKKITTPTRLPYDLVEKMIQYSSIEGDLILDPFMGSGQTAFVAKDLKRNYIGFEQNQIFYDFANQRLSTGQYTIPISELLAG